ncbi:MAG: ribbon-helix-helix domain-containing protein [Candidatus Thermoplasmatota archaeon]|nr:ribbon-helix-helix domain-containing protein [Candidatus Thermoplasmatota archaeon]
MSNMTKHTSVSLPKGMHDAIKRIIEENPELGYTSVAEYCKDILRDEIVKIRKGADSTE